MSNKYCYHSPGCEEDVCRCDKTFRDLAKYEDKDEPVIETYERNYDTIFAVLLVIVIIGFIAGEIFIRTL